MIIASVKDRLFPKKPEPQGRKKMALVLAGGGFPGWMYEIGVVTALDDFFEDGFSVNDFDIFVGTSAGACVAALLANQVRPREIFEAVREDKEGPFNFKTADIYSFGYQESFQLLKRFSSSIIPITKSLWRNRKRLTFIDVLHMIEEHLPSGLLTLKNLDQYLSSFLSTANFSNDFRKLKCKLYIPAVDVDLGRYEVFGEGELADVPISKAVTASSAIPMIFQPVHIRGRDYMDGGVGRVAYMDIAINHGSSLILVVNPIVPIINDRTKVCLPTSYGVCGSLKDKGFSFVYDQATRVSTQTRIYMAVKRYQAEYPEKDFITIHPDPSDTLMFLHSVIALTARLEILNYGYESTMNLLKAQFPALEESFSKNGVKVTLRRFQ